MFRLDYLRHHSVRFHAEFTQRLDDAVVQGRLSPEQRDRALARPNDQLHCEAA